LDVTPRFRVGKQVVIRVAGAEIVETASVRIVPFLSLTAEKVAQLCQDEQPIRLRIFGCQDPKLGVGHGWAAPIELIQVQLVKGLERTLGEIAARQDACLLQVSQVGGRDAVDRDAGATAGKERKGANNQRSAKPHPTENAG